MSGVQRSKYSRAVRIAESITYNIGSTNSGVHANAMAEFLVLEGPNMASAVSLRISDIWCSPRGKNSDP